MLLSRYDESRAHCEEAIAIARSVGARREEGHALNTLGVDLACLGDPDSAVAHLKEARAIAQEVGDVDDLARAYLNLAEILAAPLDRLEEAVELARDGIALCEEVGLDCDYGVSLRAIAAAAFSSSAVGTTPRRSWPRPPIAARSSARRSTSTWRARRSPPAAARSTPRSATSPPSAS